VRPLTPDAAAELSDDERAVKLEEYRPFQPSASGSMYSDRGGAPSGLGALGRGGVPDYLPDIPDGEITLLNAKADRHAVFVRRVALQVFGALRKLNWAEVAHSEARRLRGFVTVHATMSGEGKLLDATIEQTSGTSVFDRVVLEAASRGSWDQNPPGGARGADGNIHFIFKSRTWARLGGDGQREQRWLLLATGLL
jgi:TonB family protein